MYTGVYWDLNRLKGININTLKESEENIHQETSE